MPVMLIRHVRMSVPNRVMPMRMAVRSHRHRIVVMRVVPVLVAVSVLMLQRVVFVLV